MVSAAEIRVLSSNAMREALRELAPQFEKASGHKVSMTFAGSADILKKIRAGEGGVDLLVLQTSSIDDLAAEGKVAKGSRIDFAHSLVGVAVRAGAPKIDLSSSDSLKRALLASGRIVISSGPSGIYMSSLLERMGIPRGKVFQSAPGIQTGELVARGEADICFQQVSELLPVKGIDYLGTLPSDIRHVTVFSGGIHSAAPQPQAARELMKFLASREAGPALRKKGMEPAS